MLLTLPILLLVTCAANTNFELGRGNKIGGWEPKPVPSLEDTPIIQIVCGGYHSLALTGILTTEATSSHLLFLLLEVIVHILCLLRFLVILTQMMEKCFPGVTEDMANWVILQYKMKKYPE